MAVGLCGKLVKIGLGQGMWTFMRNYRNGGVNLYLRLEVGSELARRQLTVAVSNLKNN